MYYMLIYVDVDTLDKHSIKYCGHSGSWRNSSDVALRSPGGGGVVTSIARPVVLGLQVCRLVPGEAPDVSEVPLPGRRAGAGEAGGGRNPVVRQSGGEIRLGRVLAGTVTVISPSLAQSGLQGGVAT